MSNPWIMMDDGAPEPGDECVVLYRYEDDPSVTWNRIDIWDMRPEDPTGMESQTAEVKYGWGEYDGTVVAWIKIPEFNLIKHQEAS